MNVTGVGRRFAMKKTYTRTYTQPKSTKKRLAPG